MAGLIGGVNGKRNGRPCLAPARGPFKHILLLNDDSAGGGGGILANALPSQHGNGLTTSPHSPPGTEVWTPGKTRQPKLLVHSAHHT